MLRNLSTWISQAFNHQAKKTSFSERGKTFNHHDQIVSAYPVPLQEKRLTAASLTTIPQWCQEKYIIIVGSLLPNASGRKVRLMPSGQRARLSDPASPK
jgi:hypothetical protein